MCVGTKDQEQLSKLCLKLHNTRVEFKAIILTGEPDNVRTSCGRVILTREYCIG